MSEAPEKTEEEPKKKSKKPLMIGLVLMLALGGGGFFAVYKGLVLAPHDAEAESHAEAEGAVPLPEIAFVPITPLVVSLGPKAGGRFLHFTAQIEVEKKYEPDVTLLLPRILDVLNGYLRAVGTGELEDPDALVRLRSQMLRRVQLVTGEGRVRDLLVTEFVIN
ncbi:flagellar basal body-associated FliL family protein [Frigidibacter sp. RF13]|uniref:flagellar basal body-associated FliL family protein n=1 Tax=Frigidibacter sp. RF13 TaxID=2997340 RepID=UPI00226F99C3|nr:flagellar basal body-associated FliL family protein [Frigidibacter sp. RF13]MCY1126777.1 flagellar basal body-associated FliL family protein [Frigidibacter sp. RF13]